jgi:hypothetical protein
MASAAQWADSVACRRRALPARARSPIVPPDRIHEKIAAMKSLQSPVKKVAFYNNKGGAGKTTLSIHTALLAEEWKIRTIVACLDEQGNSLMWLSKGDKVAKVDALREEPLPVRRVLAAGHARHCER